MVDDKSNSTQAERLVQLRRDKGFTAEQLAQAMTAAGAKVSRGAISNWERGTNGIVSSKLPTLARILGCSEGYLLRGEHQNDAANSAASTDDQSQQHANLNSVMSASLPTDNKNKILVNTSASLSDTRQHSPNNAMNGHSMNTIKNLINYKTFAMTFVVPYCKLLIEWKLKANAF